MAGNIEAVGTVVDIPAHTQNLSTNESISITHICVIVYVLSQAAFP